VALFSFAVDYGQKHEVCSDLGVLCNLFARTFVFIKYGRQWAQDILIWLTASVLLPHVCVAGDAGTAVGQGSDEKVGGNGNL